jgi:hypothetical protein
LRAPADPGQKNRDSSPEESRCHYRQALLDAGFGG